MFFAVMNGRKEVVVALLAANADKTIKTKWGTAEDVAFLNIHEHKDTDI
eukprot:SAG31_NODE_662_length_13028_cov_3.364529_10_plen_49_part_00